MPGQGAIIAAGAIDYPAEYQRRRRRDARHARHQQGDDAHLHLRPPHHSGRGIGHVPGQACRTCSTARTASTRRSSTHLRMPHQPVRWETDRQPAAARRDAARHAGDRQGSGGHAADQRLPRARPPDRRSRSAGRRAELPPRARSRRPTASPSGISTANSSPAAWARPSAKAAPKPVATLREILETLRQTYCGKIGCEYMNIQHPEQKRWLQQRMEPEANNWPLDRDTRLRILSSLIAGRRVRALPARPLRRPEALLAGRRGDRDRDPGRSARARRRTTACTRS